MLDALQTSPAWLIGVCTLLGLCVGSFLNVVVYRLPLMLQRDWLSEAREIVAEISEGASRRFRVRPPAKVARAARAGPWKAKRWTEGREGEARLSLMFPPSRCPSCGGRITALQNIPVVSWLALRGKCANCRAPISARYPIVELAAGVLGGFLAWRYGYSLALAGALVFAWALLALSLIDFDTQYLPDVITLPLLWLGLLVNLDSAFTTSRASVLGAVGGYLTLWSVYWAFKLLTKKEGMGYGDFKLLAAIGAWVGWQVLPFVILVSAGLGSVIGLAAVVLKGNSTDARMPFGPYLALGGIVGLVWGQVVTRAWLGLLTVVKLSIGLTGGIGSGKSTVADLFAQLGASIVDADEISRSLTSAEGAAMTALRKEFGVGVVAPDGALDRRAMRELAFADPGARARLEAILHPLVRAESDRAKAAAQGPYVMVVVPLLFETGGQARVDRTLVVDAPEDAQVERVQRRSALAPGEVRQVMAAQWPRWRRLQMADDVIFNGAAVGAIDAQCERLHARYAAMARERA